VKKLAVYFIVFGFIGMSSSCRFRDPTSAVVLSTPSVTELQMEFVKVPAGSFIMGSSPDEKERFDDETQHEVTITRDFFIQTTAVTQDQWVRVMGYNPSMISIKEFCKEDHTTIQVNGKGIGVCPQFPMTRVSWEDVRLFIEELNKAQDGFTYRLPTEAEWEWAARSGIDAAHPLRWGRRRGYVMNVRIPESFPANALGVYGVVGNIWEWTSDWYSKDYQNLNPVDPQGPDSGPGRVFRGCADIYRDSHNSSLRIAARGYTSEGSHFFHVGFRVVRVPAK
jgi:formylglycine-generating enzyme required for sulfatase activity